MSQQEQLLARLATHRQRMAEAGNIAQARFDRAAQDAITREIEDYWKDMRGYYEQEHDG